MKVIKLAISIVLSFLAAAIGSVATSANIPTWYAGLEKPFFNPPNWLFGPVWTALYLLMGVSLYLVWVANYTKSKTKAYVLFGAQLILNAIWSLVFFGLHQPWLGLVTIIALDATVIATATQFKLINKKAAVLLMPYLAWILFATLLNLAIALLN